MKKHTIRVFRSKLPMILSISGFAMAMQATVVQAQSFPPVVDKAEEAQSAGVVGRAAQLRPVNVNKVKAPPRPPGSENVVVHVGMNPLEVQRQKRAHAPSKLEKKDHTRDDTLPSLKNK